MATKQITRKSRTLAGGEQRDGSTNGRPIEGPRKRVFTPARIVALTVIGVLVLGLGYVRFAPGDETVSVPEGAKAGDLILEPCNYATEDGSYAADCGTLVVPENRSDPQSRLIALPVTRIRAQSDQPAEPIFYLEGGPGITNMEFKYASRYAEDHDVVLVGYRGVDGSVKLDCPEVSSALRHSGDVLGEESFRATAEGVLGFVRRELYRPGGGFYAALDADSAGADGRSEEGLFYVWTPAEVRAVLGPEDADLLCRVFGVTERGSFEGGRSVLHRDRSLGEWARDLRLDRAQLDRNLASARARLFAAREPRPQPGADGQAEDEHELPVDDRLDRLVVGVLGDVLALAEPRAEDHAADGGAVEDRTHRDRRDRRRVLLRDDVEHREELLKERPSAPRADHPPVFLKRRGRKLRPRRLARAEPALGEKPPGDGSVREEMNAVRARLGAKGRSLPYL